MNTGLASDLKEQNEVNNLKEQAACAVNIFQNERNYITGVHIHFGASLAQFLDDEPETRVGYFNVIDIDGKIRKIPEIQPTITQSVKFKAAKSILAQALLVDGDTMPQFIDEELLVILKIAKCDTYFNTSNQARNAAKFLQYIGLTKASYRCEVWAQSKQHYLTYEKYFEYTSLYIQPKPPINRLIEEQVEKLVLYSQKPYELIG